jgi:hypothetical protein
MFCSASSWPASVSIPSKTSIGFSAHHFEPVLARRLRAQGLSPAASRKAAARTARREPVVLVIAAVSKFPTAAVAAALAGAAAKLEGPN